MEPSNPDISILSQCELLGLPRSSYYCQLKEENPLNLMLRRLLDKQYTRTPYYGSPTITLWLKAQGLYGQSQAGGTSDEGDGASGHLSQAQYQQASPGAQDLSLSLARCRDRSYRPVWSTDITYIRMSTGFLYLVAVLDWFSRYVLSWWLSNTLEGSFCVEALEAALKIWQPEIFNTDQRTQFTSGEFTGILRKREIAII